MRRGYLSAGENFLLVIGGTVLLALLLMLPIRASAAVTLGTANTSALTSGLVGYWPLDGGTTNWSTGTTYDVSGQGNNGTLFGFSTSTTPAIGKIGQGFKYIRNSVTASQYVKVSDSSSLDITGSDSFTIDFWVKPSVVCDSVNNQNYIEKAQDSVTPGWGIYMSTTCTLNARLVYSGARVDVGVSLANTAANFATSTWTQAVLVGNRSTNLAQWYLNGRAVGSSVSISALGDMSNGNGLEIGSGIHGLGVNTIGGIMDDVRIYKRAFSTTEVALLYAAGQANVGASPVNALSSGLVGYWTFDGALTSSIPDVSGNGFNGYLVGTNNSTSTRRAIGKIGQAFTFGGSGTGGVNVGNSDSLTPTRFTLAGWVYLNKPKTWGYNYFYGNARDCNCSGATYNGLGFAYNTTVLRGYIDNSTVHSFSVALNISTSTWAHVAFSYDGSNVRLYSNGKLISTQANTIDPGTPATFNTYLGSMGVSNGAFYTLDGKMDDFRLYNRALSDTEIAQLYASGAVNVAHSVSSNAGGPLTQGLVGYWTFDGPNMNWKTGKALDSSGSGNDGTLIGLGTTTAPTIGKVGQALKFNAASNQYVTIPHTAGLNVTNLTVSAWIKPTVLAASITGILSKYCSSSGNFAFRLNSNRTVNFTQGADNMYSTATIPLDEWTFVSATFDGTTKQATIYINGAQDKQSTLSAGISQGSANLCIGTDYLHDGTRNFTGTIDDIRMYNRVLSASEVSQLYKTGK